MDEVCIKKHKKIIEEINNLIVTLNKNKDNPDIEVSIRSLTAAKEKIEISMKSMMKEYKLKPGINETKNHADAKNLLIEYLKPNEIIPWEIPLYKYKPDGILKISGEWNFLEIETNPRNCEKDIKGTINLLDNINSIKHSRKMINSKLEELKSQLLNGKKPHLHLGFTKNPDEVIIKFIKSFSDKLKCDIYFIDLQNKDITKIN